MVREQPLLIPDLGGIVHIARSHQAAQLGRACNLHESGVVMPLRGGPAARAPLQFAIPRLGFMPGGDLLGEVGLVVGAHKSSVRARKMSDGEGHAAGGDASS
jgi:hypothetical protein